MTFGLQWLRGPLRYIPVALSTLKPSTSPRLSHVHLGLTGLTCPSRYILYEALPPENLGGDLRRIADEFSRIEREYTGAVDLSVFGGTGVERLDTINVRFSFLWGWVHCGIIGSFTAGPSALGSLRWNAWIAPLVCSPGPQLVILQC